MSEQDANLVRGTLALLILKALSWGPRHGYAVAEWIAEATEEEVLIEEGTLYPALHRLEQRGWIDAEWGQSENNRRAKFYTLSRLGREQLNDGTTSWERFMEAASTALRSTDARTA
jgi:transcriptional regulator